MTNDDLERACSTAAQCDEHDLAKLTAACLSQLGYHGRDGAKALLALIQESDDDYLAEGIAQIDAVEGVLDGRLEAL